MCGRVRKAELPASGVVHVADECRLLSNYSHTMTEREVQRSRGSMRPSGIQCRIDVDADIADATL